MGATAFGVLRRFGGCACHIANACRNSCCRFGEPKLIINGHRRLLPKLNSRKTGGQRSPEAAEVDRSCNNGWDAAHCAQPANDIGDDPSSKTIVRRITPTSKRTMTLDGQIAIPLDIAAIKEPFLNREF